MSVDVPTWIEVFAYLANVSELATVATQGNANVLNESSRGKTLKVLLRRFWPALSHLGATRLWRKLKGEDVLASRVADQVDNSHIDGNLLLLCNQVNRQTVVAKCHLHGMKFEVVDHSTSVGSQASAEHVKVLLLGRINQFGPGIFSSHLGHTSPVDDAAALALESLVTLLVAELALHGVGRTVAS
ncbi:hypothetical protein P153DRAFT_96785 [Dothidotthia symphoricarpi CBS 119687]|uniref:Uncharacterized protein n=1 Tax=Dothidotthia symphoricarpi CBS 119687 TaxID=1392245 RepID=A0A6A6AR77_9PLEO|nr:uncharacterized protein P153DRAFT_96785 [Dothidotthia symphoricarpi CBS 119687]KAF2133678.1 hypothetical protein P153DRAFT_96785 [Dothidotthia symphoricarpi CBS 119687]